MRLNAFAAAAILAYGAYADDAQKVIKEESSSTVVEASTAVAAQLPTFTVSQSTNVPRPWTIRSSIPYKLLSVNRIGH